ncbi:hypothetical protein OG196_18845 [Kitasatospora purpeofusca]|uniref:hypothetical protein n=1 Tax=Kitasatospora purpeofusca TaxID=67352 RepID=UPI002E14FC9D|nr:hypothetical protein OG196_18845 [Kitasatospora purpeofusca]
MRTTWMAAALTAALALTPVATASAAVGNGADAPHRTTFSVTPVSVPGLLDVPAPPTAPMSLAGLPALPGIPAMPAAPGIPPAPGAPAAPAAPGAPAAPAAPGLPDAPALPADAPDPTSALGGVLDLVGGLLSAVPALLGGVDLGAVQQLLASLESTLQGLLGQLPTPPTLPTPPPTVTAPGFAPPALTPPTAATPAPPASLTDRLAALRSQAKALGDAAAAAAPAR